MKFLHIKIYSYPHVSVYYFLRVCKIQSVQEAKEMRERVFVLESEQADVQPRLAQNHTLREKVSALERELLVLRGLYQRQREEARSLRARGPARQELTLLTSSLREEKEGELETSKVDKEDVNSRVLLFPFLSAVERERDKLGQEAKGLRMMLSSLEEEKRKAQEEKNELQQILQHVQGRCQEKIRVQLTPTHHKHPQVYFHLTFDI